MQSNENLLHLAGDSKAFWRGIDELQLKSNFISIKTYHSKKMFLKKTIEKFRKVQDEWTCWASKTLWKKWFQKEVPTLAWKLSSNDTSFSSLRHFIYLSPFLEDCVPMCSFLSRLYSLSVPRKELKGFRINSLHHFHLDTELWESLCDALKRFFIQIIFFMKHI